MADGRLNYCKSCVKARARKYRLSHHEQYAQYEKARANLPHRVEARRKYQEEHKEQISKYKKRWSEENYERVAAYKRAYYEQNREPVITRSKEWAEDNPEKVSLAKADNRRKRRAAKQPALGALPPRSSKSFARGMGTGAWLAAEQKSGWRLITSCP